MTLPAPQHLTFFRGEALEVTATPDEVENITGWAITVTIKAARFDASALFTLTAGAGVTIANGTGGVFVFTLTAAQTAALTAGTTYVWDAWRTDQGSQAVLCHGELRVRGPVRTVA